MREIIEKDLTLLGVLARLVERLAADGRRLKPRQVVAEFDNYLHDELDLIREASNCSQLRRNFSPAQGRGHLMMVPERSEGRRVGKECVSTCRSRGAAYH